MAHNILGRDFFERSALNVARDLLGKYLVRQIEGTVTAALISETEAYIGAHDLACHASKGCTPRTQVMFGPAGNWYVYFIYGIHEMLNVVTHREGVPAAVLLRGAGPWNGPGKLTKALAIDRDLNGASADPASGLWIEDRGFKLARSHVRRTPRIGVDFAQEWADKPYRYLFGPRADETTPLVTGGLDRVRTRRGG